MKRGLVLTAGGARAAYQVGVLKFLTEINSAEEIPFSIVAGTSAGAINGSYLVSHAENFKRGVEGLYDYWANLTPDRIFKTSTLAMARIAAGWMSSLSLGRLKQRRSVNYLLDASPLGDFLGSELRFDKINANIRSGLIHGLAISTTNYNSGTAVSFFDGDPEILEWKRSTRVGMRARLTVDHVRASSAIPLFFPPVMVGDTYYGDGGVRLQSPLSPAIHMGADRIFAIGIRHPRTPEKAMELSRLANPNMPEVADIAGVLLNAMFLDALESDLERLDRINKTLSKFLKPGQESPETNLRLIPAMALMPSQDLGKLASELFQHFPPTIRHLLQGIGASEASGYDLLSYLSFDKAFTRPLLDLGYQDAKVLRKEISSFLSNT